MTQSTTLEELLRASAVETGSISLLRIDGGEWRATVCHHNGHMVHPLGDWKADPVEALTVALIEDERLCRDLERRYAAAEKLGQTTSPEFSVEDGTCLICESGGSGCDACRPAADDMEDLLG